MLLTKAELDLAKLASKEESRYTLRITREIAQTEVYLDRQAELAGPSVPGWRVAAGRMGWREAVTVIVLALLAYGVLLVT